MHEQHTETTAEHDDPYRLGTLIMWAPLGSLAAGGLYLAWARRRYDLERRCKRSGDALQEINVPDENASATQILGRKLTAAVVAYPDGIDKVRLRQLTGARSHGHLGPVLKALQQSDVIRQEVRDSGKVYTPTEHFLATLSERTDARQHVLAQIIEYNPSFSLEDVRATHQERDLLINNPIHEI